MIPITENDLLYLRGEVQKRQTEKRFAHTCGVENEAIYIGQIFLPDKINELRAAALLHDLTKSIPDIEQIALCSSFGIVLSETDKLCPQTLHGKSAAEIIKCDFKRFATPAILRAVRLHTTGAADMTTFDKIIFLSDYIEAGRQHRNCQEMRQKFHDICDAGQKNSEQLDMTVREVLYHTLQFLKKNEISIAPETMNAFLALGGNESEVSNGTGK